MITEVHRGLAVRDKWQAECLDGLLFAETPLLGHAAECREGVPCWLPAQVGHWDVSSSLSITALSERFWGDHDNRLILVVDEERDVGKAFALQNLEHVVEAGADVSVKDPIGVLTGRLGLGSMECAPPEVCFLGVPNIVDCSCNIFPTG